MCVNRSHSEKASVGPIPRIAGDSENGGRRTCFNLNFSFSSLTRNLKKKQFYQLFVVAKKYANVFFTAASSFSLGLRHEIYFSTKEICHLRFCRFLFGSCSSFLVFSKLSRRPPPQTPSHSELLSSTVMQSSISRGYFQAYFLSRRNLNQDQRKVV